MSARRLTTFDAQHPARILLVDDHPLVRAGLTEVLGHASELLVCGEAEDHQSALAAIPAVKPNLVIVDLALKHSNGLELIKDIRVQFPKLLVLVVSMQDEMTHAERVLRAGAKGYVTKEDAITTVVRAVRQVLEGSAYVSERVAAHMAARVAAQPRAPQQPSTETLTDRELEVLELLGRGLGRQQVSDSLHIDVNTVETYRTRIKEKLQLKDANEVLQYAIRSHRSLDTSA